MSFLNGRVQVFRPPAAHTVYEVREVVSAAVAVGSGFFVAAQPGLIARGVFVSGRQISVRTIEDVADCVVVAEKAMFAGHQVSASDACLVVRNPVPDLELHHLAFAIRQIKFKTHN